MSRRVKHDENGSRRQTQKHKRGGSVAPAPALQSPQEHIAKKSKIKVIICADRTLPTLESLLRSLIRHKYSYEVVGFGKPFHGFQTKMENYLEGIRKHREAAGPEAMIILVDGFDAICIKDSDKLYKAYKKKPRKMPIVMGAEVCCIDNCDKGQLEWYNTHNIMGGKGTIESNLQPMFPGQAGFERFLRSETPVFANSGFIMGPAENILEMLEGMIATGNFDDQLAAGAYLIKNQDKIDIDLEQLMMRNKLPSRDKFPDEDGTKGPAFLHYPGMRSEEDKETLLKKYKEFHPEN